MITGDEMKGVIVRAIEAAQKATPIGTTPVVRTYEFVVALAGRISVYDAALGDQIMALALWDRTDGGAFA